MSYDSQFNFGYSVERTLSMYGFCGRTALPRERLEEDLANIQVDVTIKLHLGVVGASDSSQNGTSGSRSRTAYVSDYSQTGN
jgi:hypothetical protein